VARWETGDRAPDPTDVAQVLTVLDVSGERYDEILSMSRGTHEPRWLAVTLPEQRAQLAALLDLEATAVAITDVSPLLIPGLLQTGEYIREIMETGGVPSNELSTRVAVRIGRREAINRPDPAHLTVLLGEAALRQVIGTRELLVRQLRYVLELAARPNVELRVLPYGSGWHPALEGPFTLIDTVNDDPVVHLENRRSGLFLHEHEDVQSYRQAVDTLLKVAMSPASTNEFIAQVIEELEQR
jgi:hypothetical protein